MLKLRTSLLLLTALALLVPSVAGADLLFSEYIEGSSFNKAVEIYNPTGAPVDLSDYELHLYSNGNAAPNSTVGLAGILAAGDVFVVANTGAAAAILAVTDLQSNTVNYNGDDAFALYRVSGGVNVDVIGQIGFDPGTEWVNGGVSTLNNTMRRKAAVCTGDTDGSDVFDPSLEWDAFGNDNFDDLGAHTAACEPTPTRNSTWGRVKSLYR